MCQPDKHVWFNKADALRDEAQQVVNKALHAAGWRSTSQTPCSVWMWQKMIDGVLYSVSDSDAAMIQERADRNAYFDRFPDELGD
jgi:hypothetical protein